MREFNDRLMKENFQLVAFLGCGTFTRQDVAPIVEGRPVPFEQLEAMAEEDKFSKEELERIRAKLIDLRIELDSVMRETHDIERDIQQQIGILEHKYGSPAVTHHQTVGSAPALSDSDKKINSYLDEVQEHTLSNLKMFQEKDEDQQQQQQMPFPVPQAPVRRFIEFKVNVLVDNLNRKKTPIIIETAPTFKNLFGTIEREVDRSGARRGTDFTHIKAGSLLRANGGYIVFDALEALIEPGVWTFLKRALKSRELNMQPYDPFSFLPSAIKPEPIPLDVKVILIGDDYLYYLLYNLERDLKEIFKTKAQFDVEMSNTNENIQEYVCLIKRIVDEEKLFDFDKKAVCTIVEYGVRLTGRQKKLSTRFSEIADLIPRGTLLGKEGRQQTRHGSARG